MRILLYVLIIIAGAMIGSKVKLSELFLKNLSKIQYACLLLLLFIMGVNIGINEEIIGAFYKLGMQAIVLALSSIALSLCAVRLVSMYFQYRETVVQKNEL